MNFTRWSARLPGTQRRTAQGTEGSVPAARGEHGQQPERPADVAEDVPSLEDFSVRELLGRLPGLAALVYGPEHRIAYVNEAYAAAFGPAPRRHRRRHLPGGRGAGPAAPHGPGPAQRQAPYGQVPPHPGRRLVHGHLPARRQPRLDGGAVLVHAADVTDHAEAAERLRASERKHRQTAVTLQRSLLPQKLEQPTTCGSPPPTSPAAPTRPSAATGTT